MKLLSFSLRAENCPRSYAGQTQSRGAALVIVLAFVVLLTGVIVAFFSRSLVQRQSSNATSNQTKADLFADGAVETIIDDLKQEIADGSSASSSPATGVTLYVPKSANMVPERPASIQGVAGLENLVKLSGETFSTGANAAKRAGTDAKLATDQTSQNGRYITRARWNKPLLLPKKNATTDWPLDPIDKFTVPKWILVARDGSNPGGSSGAASFGGTGNTVNNAALTNNGFVVGRYAYAIYDEGGLLDMNAAGYPTTTTASVSATKPGLPYADLKQIPGIGATDALTGVTALASGTQDNLINRTVGVRNLVSGDFDSSVAVPAVKTTTPTTYFNFIMSNPAGFIGVGPSTPVSVSGQSTRSDRPFTTRQDLIQFLTSSLIVTGSGDRACVQNALRYFTHFTRALNQPSRIPDHIRDSSAPQVQSLTSGGNSEGQNGKTDTINPSFLQMRVKTAFNRNDPLLTGTAAPQATPGEPLVKKRFALNRLAWLTYKGPSQGRTGTDIDDLKNNFGFTQAFLDEGTAANIQKYFGLNWATDHWIYNVHSTSGIMTLDQVRDANREPDFFELLKAAISAGSLGKSLYGGSGVMSSVTIQYIADSSLDCQVIQLGANIIDQFDVDGYPTRIQFPYYSREFRGVENLPYLYRVRSALWILKQPTTAVPQPEKRTQSTAFSFPPGTTKDGLAAMMLIPEIWNPHYYDPSPTTTTVNRILGNPRPSNFKLYAYTSATDINGSPTGTSGYYVREAKVGAGAETQSSQRSLTADNTEMDFQNTPNQFREPTMLLKAGGDGNLQAPGLAQADGLATGNTLSIINNTSGFASSLMPSGSYVGIYVGQFPILWNGPSYSNNPVGRVTAQLMATKNNQVNGADTDIIPEVTYQLRYENGSGGYSVYDEKYAPMVNHTIGVGDAGNPLTWLPESTLVSTTNFPAVAAMGMNRFACAFDPRTSRFGFLSAVVNEYAGGRVNEIPPGNYYDVTGKILNKSRYIMPTMRSDSNAGYGVDAVSGVNSEDANNSYLTSTGWHFDNTGSALMRLGLMDMNSSDTSSAANNQKRFDGDGAATDGSSKPQYYQDADGVVRRGMAAYTSVGSSSGGAPGQPMATAFEQPLNARQKESRPLILNRPFRTVGELGYVFSGTPWKNLDFSTPESGFSGLLDVFSISDTDDSKGMVAGKVNLNTRQASVLKAIMAGAYRDEYGSTSAPAATATDAQKFADALVSRTSSSTSGKGPLMNPSELVGKWVSGANTSAVYDGFSKDLDNSSDSYLNNITRYREAPIRALAAAGQTRVWNLMIDVVAQTGRYPQTASAVDKFVVEGEQRYWVHVALDRFTGEVVDKQIEVVKE